MCVGAVEGQEKMCDILELELMVVNCLMPQLLTSEPYLQAPNLNVLMCTH